MPGAGSNAQSTAFGVQGLLAAGVDPGSLHRRGAPAPLDYLRSLIADDGHVRYSRSADQTPVWVTAEALMALDGKPLPIVAVARRITHTRAAPTTHPAASHAHPPASPAPRRATRSEGRHPRRTRLAPASSGAPTTVDALAVDAGVLTALSLAFVATN